MRRSILGAFLFLAACGGGVRSTTDAVKPSADLRAQRQGFLLTADAQTVIAAFAKSSSQDAIDTCLNAWVEEAGAPAFPEGPVVKPDTAGFRAFLSECLGVAVPSDLRASQPDARVSTVQDMRAAPTRGELRISNAR